MNLAGAALDGGVLAGSAGPQAAPLGKNPLGKNPLGKNPLGKNPLGKNPLGKNPLGKNPLGKNGLNDTQPPLRDAPVSTLINHAIANPPLLTSMPISTAGGWAARRRHGAAPDAHAERRDREPGMGDPEDHGHRLEPDGVLRLQLGGMAAG